MTEVYSLNKSAYFQFGIDFNLERYVEELVISFRVIYPYYDSWEKSWVMGVILQSDSPNLDIRTTQKLLESSFVQENAQRTQMRLQVELQALFAA